MEDLRCSRGVEWLHRWRAVLRLSHQISSLVAWTVCSNVVLLLVQGSWALCSANFRLVGGRDQRREGSMTFHGV